METLTNLINTFKDNQDVAIIYRTDFRTFKYTYREIYELSMQMSVFLNNQGIKKGDRVLIWGPNNPAWVVSFLGIISSGAIAVPADLLGTIENTATVARLSEAKLILKTKYRPALPSPVPSFYLEDIFFELEKIKNIGIPVTTKENDIVELVYTSGTTGSPKGVALSHKNITANVKAVSSVVSITKKDTMLSTLPLSHMFEQTAGLFTPLSHGGRIVYMTSLKSSALFGALAKEKITMVLTVPRLLQSLKTGILAKVAEEKKTNIFNRFLSLSAHHPWLAPFLFHSVHKRFGSQFRFFVSGGASLDGDTEKFWHTLGFNVLVGYGLTECAPVLTVNPEKSPRIGTVGKPLSNVEICIAEDDEILAKGPGIFSGYWQDEARTQATFRDGWFLTGDVGALDVDGYLSIKSRKKDVIVTANGVNIYPEDIEGVLSQEKDVRECCIISIPSSHGEEIHAVVVLNTGGKIEQTIANTNAKLDSAQQIMSFTLWDKEFPRTSTLKIKKNQVREKILNTTSVSEEKNNNVSENKLIILLKRITGKQEITPEMQLVKDLKLDSIGRVELVAAIEQEYYFDFEEELITPKTTVADLEHLVSERTKGTAQYSYPKWTEWLVVRILGNLWLEIINLSIWRPFCLLKTTGNKSLSTIKGPVIFVSNHISYADHSCIIRALPMNFRYKTSTPAWGEFFFPTGTNIFHRMVRRIFYYYCITTLRLFMMFEYHSFNNGLKHAGLLVDQGENILIFPEGGHTRTKEMLPFKNGTAILIQQLKIPVIPIGLNGLEYVYPHDAMLPKPGRVHVNFGTPIIFKNESLQEITERLRSEVEKLRQQK